jgi:hypothetical protein
MQGLAMLNLSELRPGSMTHPFGNVYRIPRHFNWPLVIGGYALLALLMMMGRWGAVEAESSTYLGLAH